MYRSSRRGSQKCDDNEGNMGNGWFGLVHTVSNGVTDWDPMVHGNSNGDGEERRVGKISVVARNRTKEIRKQRKGPDLWWSILPHYPVLTNLLSPVCMFRGGIRRKPSGFLSSLFLLVN